MTPVPGSGSSPRGETKPPTAPTEKFQRSGYAMLAVSGLVVATAFAGVAELVGGGVSEAGGPPAQGTAPAGGAQLIPGNGVPGTDTMTVTGVAEAGELPSTSAPTTVVSVGPDGTPTTTVLPPPPPGTPNQPGPSGRSDLPGSTTRPGGGNSSTPPPDTGTTPPPDTGTTPPPDTSTTPPPDTSTTPPPVSEEPPEDTAPPGTSGSGDSDTSASPSS